MTIKKIDQILIFILFFFGTIYYNIAIAQTNNHSEENYQLHNGMKGEVSYHFQIKNRDTIWNNGFEFNKSIKDSSDQKQLNGIHIAGNFKNGYKDQKWDFSSKQLTPSQDISINGYYLKYLSNGTENSVNAYFTNGNASRKWESKTVNITNSKIDDTLFLAQSFFDNNHFSGDFYSVKPGIRIIGQTDDDGFFHGEWIFEFDNKELKKIKEVRTFEKGILVDHTIEKDGEKYNIKHVGLDKTFDEDEVWVEIEADSDFFDIIFQTNFGKEKKDDTSELTDRIIQESNTFLKQSIISFVKSEDKAIWSITEDSNIKLPLLKIKKYAYTEEEKNLIDSALRNIHKSKTIVNNYLKDPQVELNKHSYKELALYYEIYSEYIDEIIKLEKVFNLFNLPSYEYINREKIMPYIFEEIHYPSEVTFEFKDEIKKEVIEFPENLKVEDATIKSLAQHANEILILLKAKLELVEPIIERNRKRFEIEDKEKELLLYRDSIKTLFSNTLEDENFNSLHHRYGENIISYSSNQFKEYAKLPIEERVEITDKLLNCLRRFIESYNQFTKLQEQTERIKEEYTRVVWNPFTFTDMDEIVKERVYNAYSKDLIPFLLDDLKNNITCNKIELRLQNFTKVYEKMMVLRNQDTKEIERALRRVHDPKKIIEILSLELELN